MSAPVILTGPSPLVPRRRDFDRLERRQLFGWNEQRDTSRLAGPPLNEAAVVEGHDHAMDRGRRHVKELQKVALGRRPAMLSILSTPAVAAGAAGGVAWSTTVDGLMGVPMV